MDTLQPLAFAYFAAIIATYVVRWYNNPLRAIPTVGGSSLPGFSYISAVRNMGDIRAVLLEGYRKFPDSAFKISMLDQWFVVVSGRDMVEDISKRPEEELKSPRGALEHFCEPAVHLDEYHLHVLKEKLTRSLPTILPEVIDEVADAVNEHIAAKENEWASVEVLTAIQKVVARASNRAFVGLPLCRNEEYLTLAIEFAAGFKHDSMAVRLLPKFLRP